MPKLTDPQLVILSAAAQRAGGAVLPLPKSLNLDKTAVSRVIKGFLKRGLIAERPAGRNDDGWREAGDGGRVMLVITGTGLKAIGVDTEDGPSKQRPGATTRRKKRGGRGAPAASGRRSKVEAAPAGARPGTKQALLIDLLRRKRGVTIAEIAQATGWQQHSVRGAISGTLKKKLGLTVENEVVEKRGRVYRIGGHG